MAELKPTDEQAAVVSAAREASASIQMPAFAGCTKTSTLVMAGKVIKCPALGLVFNKRNQEEMKPKFGGNFSIRTPHSLGLLAWTRANPQVIKMTVDDRKLYKICKQVVDDRQVRLSQEQQGALRDFVKWAMILGLVPKFAGEGLVEDSPEGWAQVADSAGLDEADAKLFSEMAPEALRIGIQQARQGILSYDDMIYCSAMLGGSFPKYPLIMTDETQDLSPLNLVQVQKALSPSGLLMAVGDEKQGIYAWRGATQGMDEIRQLRPEGSWKTLPLTMTFRCPRLVVERQQGHAKGFRAAAGNREGRFRRWFSDPEALDGGWDWSEVENMRPPGGTLAVLCRNNAPLLKLAFRLIRKRVGVEMLGRDIAGGLQSLSKKLGPEDGQPAAEFAKKLLEWEESQVALALANQREAQADSVRDKAECLRACLEDAEVRTAGELRRVLDLLFGRRDGQVILSSIHKAKGMEWDLVLHLDPWRIPSKRAAAQGGIALEQEYNLRYVCETRTKDVLVEADLGGMKR